MKRETLYIDMNFGKEIVACTLGMTEDTFVSALVDLYPKFDSEERKKINESVAAEMFYLDHMAGDKDLPLELRRYAKMLRKNYRKISVGV